MVRHTDYGPKWEQSDYDRAKRALEDTGQLSFNGSSSGHGSVEKPSLDFVINGRSVRCEEVAFLEGKLRKSLSDEGFAVECVEIKADYAGAYNHQLMFDVTFDSEVYLTETNRSG